VIEGALKHQKYVDIAESFERSEGHVKDTGYEILQILSDIFEEPVKKGNLKSVLERQRSINFSVGDGSYGNIGHVIGCVSFDRDRTKSTPNKTPSEKPDSQQDKQISKIKKLQDLGLTNDEIVELLDIPLELIESLP
jgi:hypothetical protein